MRRPRYYVVSVLGNRITGATIEMIVRGDVDQPALALNAPVTIRQRGILTVARDDHDGPASAVIFMAVQTRPRVKLAAHGTVRFGVRVS